MAALSPEHALAAQMSCAAMSGMAAREFEADCVHQEYMLLDPTCERFHSLMDRGLEHSLFKTWESKKQCVGPRDGTGPWSGQFELITGPACFEISTRAKTIGAASSRSCGLKPATGAGAGTITSRPQTDPRLQYAAATAVKNCHPR